jgi:maltose alpha-D-glucosyltransferase/alpha-amylase
MASRAPRSDGEPRADPARVEAALGRAVSAELPSLLVRQRWFGDKGRTIRGARLRDCGALGPRAWLVLVDVTFAEGSDETYAVPLVLDGAGTPAGSLAMTLDLDGVAARAGDAFDDPEFCLDLLSAFERDARVPTSRGGTIRFIRTERCPPLARSAALAPRRLTGEQSNTSVAYGDRLILKGLRRVKPGITLDYEVGAFLTFRARFPHVPPLAGAIEYVPAAGEVTTLGVLQGYIANQGDGWSWVVGHLRQLPPERVDELSAQVFRELAGLGAVTGALHGALASDSNDPGFAPELITDADMTAWIERIVDDVGRTCEALRARLADVPRELEGDARALLAGEAALRARARDLQTLGGEGCMKIRVHGDYHLGQTLRTEAGFIVLDFEGEPARPLAERRRKQSVLVDVAGMLRSLDYAVHAAVAQGSAPTQAGERWVRSAGAAFLEGYLAELGKTPVRLLPASPAGRAHALSVFELDKALYEVRYELDSRPAWLGIPLRGLVRLLTRARAVS